MLLLDEKDFAFKLDEQGFCDELGKDSVKLDETISDEDRRMLLLDELDCIDLELHLDLIELEEICKG